MADAVKDFVIDFSKEEDVGSRIRVPEGWYKVKCVGGKRIKSEEKGTPGIELSLVILEGKHKKKKAGERLWMTPKAYSRFRTLLEAVGKKVPGKVKASTIINAVKGEEFYVEFADEEREGYDVTSRVTFRGFMSVDDYEEDYEDQEDDEEEDDIEEEDEDLDEDEEDEDDDEDEDDEEEEEEEEKPKRRRRSRKKKQADDDIEELDLEDL